MITVAIGTTGIIGMMATVMETAAEIKTATGIIAIRVDIVEQHPGPWRCFMGMKSSCIRLGK